MNGNLRRALHKARFFHGRTWCGCFTPSEINELLKAGALPTESDLHYVKRIPQYIKNGDSSLRWFYFYPNRLNLNKPDSHDKTIKYKEKHV